jgi:hypothetical protein
MTRLVSCMSCTWAVLACLCIRPAHAVTVSSHPRLGAFWPSPFPAEQAALDSVIDYSTASHLAVEYQYRPLTARLASPDPQGRTLSLVEHWALGRWGGALKASQHFELGLVQTWSFGHLGAGLDSLTSIDARSSGPLALGDAHLSLRCSWPNMGGGRLGVLQRVTLPWGSSISLLHSTLTYAPALQWSRELNDRWTITGRAGAHLRAPNRYMGVAFGSAAEFQLSASAHLSDAWLLQLQWSVAPALTSDEQRFAEGASRSRRAPSTLELASIWMMPPFALTSSIGTSIPLSRQQDQTGSSRWSAGPPGPALTAVLRLDWFQSEVP